MRVTYHYDAAEAAEMIGADNLRRFVELAVVNEVIDLRVNRPRLRALVARAIGYDDLADYLEAEIARVDE